MTCQNAPAYRHGLEERYQLADDVADKKTAEVVEAGHPPQTADAPATPSRSLAGTPFASFAYPDFVYLWMGQVAHSGALWADMVARPLLVLAVADSPIHLGLVMAARTVPSFSLGLIAGVVADMFDRRRVILTSKVAAFVLGTVFAALLVTDRIDLWHIYLFTLLRGATGAFDQPARRAMIPSIVPRQLVTNAMALSSGSMQVMRIGGAAGAGVVIALAGIEAAFVAIAVLYAVAVLFTWMMKTDDHEGKGYRGVRGMGSDLMEGLRYATSDANVRGLIVIAAGYYVFGMAFLMVFAPLFATDVLGIGEGGFGYLMAVTGVGGILGTLVVAGVNPAQRRGLLVVAVVISVGVLQIAFAGSTYLGSVALAFGAVAALGFGQAMFLPVINAMLVSNAPEDMRGRVMSLLSLDRATATLGAAIAGFTAALVGAQLGQIIFGVCCIITAVAIAVAFPAVRRID